MSINEQLLLVIGAAIIVLGIQWLGRQASRRFPEIDLTNEEKISKLEQALAAQKAKYEEKIKNLEAAQEQQRQYYEEQIRQLERAQEDLRNYYENRLMLSDRRIDNLIRQLIGAGINIKEPERLPRQDDPAVLTKPLLLICGTENTFVSTDRMNLRKAGIPFHRILHATKSAITAELRRRRHDNTLYRWVHVTAHAGPEGILLEDGIADPAWWGDTLKGIEVVFLAACKTSAVADALAGMVTVIYVLEDLDNTEAGSFTYAFWKGMKEHGDPRQAFHEALTEVPKVAEFADILTR